MPRLSRRKTSAGSATRRSTPHETDHTADELSTATLQQLSAITAKTLRQRLAAAAWCEGYISARLLLPLETVQLLLRQLLHLTQTLVAENATTSQVTASPSSHATHSYTLYFRSANRGHWGWEHFICLCIDHQFLSQALQLSAPQHHLQLPFTATYHQSTANFFNCGQQSRTITTQSAPNPLSNSQQVFNDDALSTASSYHLMLIILKPILQTLCYRNLFHQFLCQCSNVS